MEAWSPCGSRGLGSSSPQDWCMVRRAASASGLRAGSRHRASHRLDVSSLSWHRGIPERGFAFGRNRSHGVSGGEAMIAAIYARKSTDQNIADNEKSVARQVARARSYAERKGWTVADEHIYVDDGISGADFVRREAYLRLINSLKSRPPFQLLVMMEQTRLGRSLD